MNSWIVPPAEVVGARAIHIGDGVAVMEHSALIAEEQSTLRIGDGAVLARGVRVTCTSSVDIGAAVSSSDFAVVTDSLDARDGPVVIGEGAYLGYGSLVGPGVTVGAGAFIGEGAVVLEDVAPHTVVYGNPAVRTRRYDGPSGVWVGRHLP